MPRLISAFAMIIAAETPFNLEPQNSNSNVILNNLGVIILIVIVGGAFFLKWWRRYQASKVVVDAPVLMSRYMTGMKLEKMSSGNINDYSYSLLMTQPIQIEVPEGPIHYSDSNNAVGEAIGTALIASHNMSNAGKIIMTLQLPVKSPVHITSFGVADTKTHSLLDKELTSYNLEPASLEGDFPDYFSLYCTKDYQIELREVLDPATMAFLVDFCQREDWELFEDTVYFAENNVNKGHGADNTSLVDDAQQFVKKALPVLQRMQPKK